MKRNSFTLIEILGVVVIITILATLGFAGYSYARNKSKESATQGLITRLNAAFEFAKQKSGFIPPASGSFVTINIDTANAKITINGVDYKLATDATGKNKMYSEFYKNFIRTIEMPWDVLWMELKSSTPGAIRSTSVTPAYSKRVDLT